VNRIADYSLSCLPPINGNDSEVDRHASAALCHILKHTNSWVSCEISPLDRCDWVNYGLLVLCLLTSCQRLVENLLQGCWAQWTCYKLLSSCNSTICQQVVSDKLVATWRNNSIVTTCWQACYKPVANTSCWQVVIFTCVECYKIQAFCQIP
jgi:hypothetical protein